MAEVLVSTLRQLHEVGGRDIFKMSADEIERLRHALYLVRHTSIYAPNSPRELLESQLDKLAAIASAAWHDHERDLILLRMP